MQVGDVTRSYCRACVGERNCEVKGFHRKSGEDDYVSWHTDWSILQCRGCDEVFCQTVSGNSESYFHYYDENGDEQTEADEKTSYWPAKSKRARPNWLDEYGSTFSAIEGLDGPLNELYIALDNDLTMLATIGVRTIFDVCSAALKVDVDISFEKKLQELVTLGKIGVAEKENLETLVEAGNASVHRGWLPNPKELNTIVDILEHFLNFSFVEPEKRKELDGRAKQLKTKVPMKQKNAKASAVATP